MFKHILLPTDGPPLSVRTANKCDLIFTASHGRRSLSGLPIGSKTTTVLTHCAPSLLV